MINKCIWKIKNQSGRHNSRHRHTYSTFLPDFKLANCLFLVFNMCPYICGDPRKDAEDKEEDRCELRQEEAALGA